MSLVAARDRASELARIRDEELLDSRGVGDGLASELRRVEAEGERLKAEGERLKGEGERMKGEGERMAGANRELEERLVALEAQREEFQTEVERLGALLEQIYSSRTWKLHELLDSLRGRTREK
jgi:chromosome segregation ATPase